MKKAFTVMLFFALLGFMNTTLFAAELLHVKPILAGDSISIEIYADTAMKYKYYKVPGQARAVIDIAEADPEKIEPLLIVNKGVVTTISVDGAKISGAVNSRIIFNLSSEADIHVTATPDRKLLVVTFGALPPVANNIQEIKSDSMPEVKPVAGSVAATQSVNQTAETTIRSTADVTALPTAPTSKRMPKLEPVVPVVIASSLPSKQTIKEIVTGTLSVEIHTSQPVPDYKTMKLSSPDRLVIDIPCEKADQRPKVTAINKFGISKVRIGVSPKNIRVVMDSNKAEFPAHTITRTEYGLQINFK